MLKKFLIFNFFTLKCARIENYAAHYENNFVWNRAKKYYLKINTLVFSRLSDKDRNSLASSLHHRLQHNLILVFHPLGAHDTATFVVARAPHKTQARRRLFTNFVNSQWRGLLRKTPFRTSRVSITFFLSQLTLGLIQWRDKL